MAGGGAVRCFWHTDTLGGGEAHSPLTCVVTPLAVSAGGGMFPEDDDRLPCAADPERAALVTRRVELDSSEISDCAYVAIVEAPTK